MKSNWKFRAWYVPDLEKSILLPFTLECVKGKHVFEDASRELQYPMQVVFDDDDWVVEEAIGVTASNGEEIYVGDVLKVTIDFSVVGEGVQEFTLSVHKSIDTLTRIGQFMSNGATIEVIGNIIEVEVENE